MLAWKMHDMIMTDHTAIQKRFACMRLAKLSLYGLTFSLVLAMNGCGPAMTAQAVQQIVSMPIQVARSATTIRPRVEQPKRLIIPSIGVDAAVELVGVLSNGNLATPTQSPWDDVGWYADGIQPGKSGSAVIDGHLDRPGGFPAIFWSLRNMHIGDEVMVINIAGKVVHFRATHIALYTPEEAPIQEIFGDGSGSYLNLITCAGDWIPSQHQTTLRLVVYTTLVQ